MPTAFKITQESDAFTVDLYELLQRHFGDPGQGCVQLIASTSSILAVCLRNGSEDEIRRTIESFDITIRALIKARKEMET